MKVEEIIKNIFWLDFDTQEDLCSTFIRFQEYYESPKFKNKIFTIEEYKKWYSEKYGSFTYYTDWSGFNFPSYILQPFYDGKFNPLSEKEKIILNNFKEIKEKFYIIGTYEGDTNTLEHEIAHGLFYIDEHYRKEVKSIIELDIKHEVPEMKKVSEYILLDYHQDSLIDEINSYILFDQDRLIEYGINMNSLSFTTKRLKILNERYK